MQASWLQLMQVLPCMVTVTGVVVIKGMCNLQQCVVHVKTLSLAYPEHGQVRGFGNDKGLLDVFAVQQVLGIIELLLLGHHLWYTP